MNIYKKKKNKKILLYFCFVCFVFLLKTEKAFSASPTNFKIQILSYCGNNIAELNEQCDGSDLRGQTCVSKGFQSGNISCNSNCLFNTTNCSSASQTNSGGGGGGGSNLSVMPITSVTFYGVAYPGSVVTLLKDAQVAVKTVAGSDANFQMTLSGISGGNYIFSVYSEDNNKNKSALLNFPVSLVSGASTSISGIFIAPTISIDKSEVKKGDNITIFGQSVPNSEITISVHSEAESFVKMKSNNKGFYLHNFDTSILEIGEHQTKAKASIDGNISSFSKSLSFFVSSDTSKKENQTSEISKGDINQDNRINLIDFSILAYWYKRNSPPAKVDLNGDNKINLIDFSILAFNWTG